MRQRINFALASLLLASACGGAIDVQENDDLSARNLLWTIQRDERKCAAPMCGGYFARQLASGAQAHVGDLDLSRAGLDAGTQQMVRAAPAEELIFSGHLNSSGRALIVKQAWRGMPGIVPAANDAVYSLQQAGSSGAAVASDMISGKTASVAQLSVAQAAKGFVDQGWLANRALRHGALVAGHLDSSGLSASQVWLRLPETVGPCPAVHQQACGAGQTQSYVRTADRCLVAAGCVTPGICSMMRPSCSDGYLASTWTTAPNACLATACDPAWVVVH